MKKGGFRPPEFAMPFPLVPPPVSRQGFLPEFDSL